MTNTSSSPTLRCIGSIYSRQTEETFLEFEYAALGGGIKVVNVPRELMRSPHKIADFLLKKDADVEGDPVKAVKAALAARDARHRESTGKTGWEGNAFIYPGETFGELAGKVIYDWQDQIDPALGLTAGTLEDWKAGIKSPCRHSDFLILAASLAPASSLLELAREDEGVIFHLHGTQPKAARHNDRTKSSSGKTTAARVSTSMIGRCRKTDLVSFAITERAVEDFCFAHNHLSVALDEEGRSLGAQGGGSKVKLALLPYLIPSGRGTLRSKAATGNPALQNLTWAALAISTGENPIDDATSPRPEGAQVRAIGISVPSGRKGGIFNRVKGSEKQRMKKSADLVAGLEQAIAENYGVAMPAFLNAIVPKKSEVSEAVKKLISDFLTKVGVGESTPWERRFAGKFGIVYAAAHLMAEYQIGPWSEKRATLALKRLYRRARSATVSPAEATDAFVRRIGKLVSAGKRFPSIGKGEHSNAKGTWGMVRKIGASKRAVLIRHSRMKHLVKPAAASTLVLAELDTRGILVKATDGKLTRQFMANGKRCRYVTLNYDALEIPAPKKQRGK